MLELLRVTRAGGDIFIDCPNGTFPDRLLARRLRRRRPRAFAKRRISALTSRAARPLRRSRSGVPQPLPPPPVRPGQPPLVRPLPRPPRRRLLPPHATPPSPAASPPRRSTRFSWRGCGRRKATWERQNHRPRTTSSPARSSSTFAFDSLPTRSVSMDRSMVTIWETLATESFGRLVRGLGGADCPVRPAISGWWSAETHTTVAMRLRFNASP